MWVAFLFVCNVMDSEGLRRGEKSVKMPVKRS